MAETAEELSKHRDVRAPARGLRHALLSGGDEVYSPQTRSCRAPSPDPGRRRDHHRPLASSGAISLYSIARVSDPSTRFTLKRIKRLIVFLLVLLVGISVVFVNWYTALISVGVVSVIVGLSVQTPITSFIGWIYILVPRPSG